MSRLEYQEAILNNDPKIKLVKNENAKSPLWAAFFRIQYDNELVNYICCIYCKTVLAHTPQTGTGTMHRHKCRTEKEMSMKPKMTQKYTRKKIPNAVLKHLASKYLTLVDRELLLLNVAEDNDFREYAQALINLGAKYGKVHVDDALLSPAEIEKCGIDASALEKSMLKTDDDDGDPLTTDEVSSKRQRLDSDQENMSEHAYEDLYDSVLTYDNESLSHATNKVIVPKIEITEPTPDKSNLKITNVDSMHKQRLAGKYQELVEKEILTIEEKREQQKKLHELQLRYMQEEFKLKMQTMREEHKLKKLKLEMEMKTTENGLNSIDSNN